MQNLRVGTGYDVHRLVPDRPLILGGVEIEHPLGLLGHSDSDVLVHAIMDSLAGALAIGDIGQLFPDTDPAYEGISSLKLLEKVNNLIKDKNYRICNIDATVTAQKPKLAPIIPEMRANIARILGINIDQISIKATTQEGLGFTGREEGISAEAICLLEEAKSMIGIIIAIDEEYDALVRLIEDKKEKRYASMKVVVGFIKDIPVVLVKSGQGKVNAAAATQMIIDRYRPDYIINVGIGGSLSDELGVGDIVISEDSVQYDVEGADTELGQIPELNTFSFPASEELITLACKAAEKFHLRHKVGRVLSADIFVDDSEVKKNIVDTFGGLLCEMEGAAVGHVCYLNQVPYLIIRSVSDTASDDAFGQVMNNGLKVIKNTAKIVEYIVLNLKKDEDKTVSAETHQGRNFSGKSKK